MTDTLTYRQACDLTAQIKDKVVTIQANIDRLAALVRRAKDGDAHVVLGFASWTAYIADTVGADPLDLTRAERKKLVTFLASEGMSTRAIAPVVGVSQRQVANDVTESTEQKVLSRPETVTGLDGRDRPATQPVKPAAVAKVTTKTESYVDTETGEVTDKPAEWASPTVILNQPKVPTVEEVVADEPSVQRARYIASLYKNIQAAGRLTEFQVNHVADLTTDEFASIDRLIDGLTRWRDAIRAARPRHLRSM